MEASNAHTNFTKSSHVSACEMHGHAPAAAKDTWIFNAEATSTLLIAAWYIFGVYITLGVIPKNAFYAWGAHWVIPFLLGVFYLGAGYLYQKHQCVVSLKSSVAYLRREVIVLLVPFLAFLVLTLLATSVASLQPGLVASGLAAGQPGFTVSNLAHALFIHPVGPVGYFIILLVIYVITHTPQTKRGVWVLLICALVAKVIAVVLSDLGLAVHMPYYLLGIMDNWIWFVLGIALCAFEAPKCLARPVLAAGLTVAFFILAALLLLFNMAEAALLGVLTLLGLLALYALSAARFLHGSQVRFYGFVTRYTMAIWLMHQILSVLVFCGLYALGFHAGGMFAPLWVPVNAIACLIACYPLPVFVMWVLSRIGKLGFIVYPSRYLPALFGK